MIIIATFALSSIPSVSYGAIVVIGPIPIVVASDVAIALLMLIIAAIIFATIFFLAHIGKEYEVEIERFEPPMKKEKKFGGIVLIGPLPIIFGDAKIAIFASLIALILMLIAIAFMMGWFP